MTDLEILENKIKLVTSLVEKLFLSNQELLKENKSLTNQLKDTEEQIKKIKSEGNNFVAESVDTEHYKDKEDKLKQKIEQILTKLENFQKLSSHTNNQ
ncbi:hypothetical protein B6I21_01605 [candidate division KSB1 bacterium 4572_119]|nr:MAG: hypothetical protein B6I21_01605 [candidate division KSB1 bacterium 4572_119]